ncbi:MAG: hypothetical protein MHMPM18_001122 [Marteilia pararefringens]
MFDKTIIEKEWSGNKRLAAVHQLLAVAPVLPPREREAKQQSSTEQQHIRAHNKIVQIKFEYLIPSD